MDNRLKGTYATIIAALLWSTAGLFIILLPQDAFSILFYRSLFAALTFAAILGSGVFKYNKLTIIGTFFYTGVVMCFVTSTKMVGAANAIFLQYAAPAYVLVAEPFLFKTKMKRIDIITVGLCIIGLLLFFVDQFETPKSWLGTMIAVFSGFMWTGLVLSQSRNTKEYQGGTIFYGNILVLIITIPWVLKSGLPNGIEMTYLAYLGVIQLGIGFYLFTYGQRHISVIDSSLIAMLEPLLNPVWVLVGTGQIPTYWALIGGMIILGSLVYRLVFLKVQKRKLIV